MGIGISSFPYRPQSWPRLENEREIVNQEDKENEEDKQSHEER
jgi:hypothetical protein